MHEFSICESIIKQLAKANNESLDNIDSVTVAIGELANIDVESLKFWFPVVLKNMNCQQLKLVINMIDALVQCNDCQAKYRPKTLYESCPACNSVGNNVIHHGRELNIISFTLYF